MMKSLVWIAVAAITIPLALLAIDARAQDLILHLGHAQQFTTDVPWATGDR
jgi:hypothetical protein